ncbi:MAG: ATP synthase F1 subunit epsilon [Bacteroidales bacterium]|nr:ATP synthase F1 subunit epsilon [Bacteroidales bacterium]MBR3608519.1 ATP synthase F1 subunit epsilon [Bacteroidales bacterium]MBR4119849.1 ATP synthase F1 subunit epsilon [Bacteroidales bacterium]
MKLQIISTDGIIFSGEVTKVTLPGTLGSFTILENHASLLSTLTQGELEYESDGKLSTVKINGGFIDVNNNNVSVCIS